MKATDKKTIKKPKNKKKPFVKPKNEKVLIVAQEFKFAKLLSGNEKKTRDRVLKSLKKWLLNCFAKNYVFKEDDFIRVWKGLFYAVWMSDKPLVQEDLCESIAQILDLFPNEQLDNAIMMTKVGFKVLAIEWYGIDQHRMDKFLMLVRRYLRGSFRVLHRTEWKLEACKKYADMWSSEDGLLALKTPFYARNAISLILHIIDCYLEELSKISKGNIPNASVVELLSPFLQLVCLGETQDVCMSARHLLTDLVKQSEAGLKYAGATAAWKRMGCPAGGPDALELVSDEDDEDHVETKETYNTPLDPRAGRVDVVLEPLPVPADLIAKRLQLLMKKSASKAYKRARVCLQRFEKLAQNDYPLKIKGAEPEPKLRPVAKRRAAAALKTLEKDLIASSDELALRGLRRKHRKRLLAKTRAGLSIVEDLQTDTQTNLPNGDTHEDGPTSKENKSKLNEIKNKNNKRKNSEISKSINGKKAKIDKKVTSSVDLIKRDSRNANKENEEKANGVGVALKSKNPKPSKTELGKKSIENTDSSNKTNVSDENKTNIPKSNVSKTSLKGKDSTQSKNKKVEDTKIVGKGKKFEKQEKKILETPKKVKFVLKNNCMQGTIDYYKSVRQSPNIPFDGTKKPVKTNLKPSTPSPINPFFKKKLKLKGKF